LYLEIVTLNIIPSAIEASFSSFCWNTFRKINFLLEVLAATMFFLEVRGSSNFCANWQYFGSQKMQFYCKQPLLTTTTTTTAAALEDTLQ
jgi:hypothetical protein